MLPYCWKPSRYQKVSISFSLKKSGQITVALFIFMLFCLECMKEIQLAKRDFDTVLWMIPEHVTAWKVSVFGVIQSEYGKMRSRITPNTDTFYAVCPNSEIQPKYSMASKTQPPFIQPLIVINRNTRTRCKIFSKLTIKTPERPHWSRSGVIIVNFEHISHLALVFLLLTLNM